MGARAAPRVAVLRAAAVVVAMAMVAMAAMAVEAEVVTVAVGMGEVKAAVGCSRQEGREAREAKGVAVTAEGG